MEQYKNEYKTLLDNYNQLESQFNKILTGSQASKTTSGWDPEIFGSKSGYKCLGCDNRFSEP